MSASIVWMPDLFFPPLVILNGHVSFYLFFIPSLVFGVVLFVIGYTTNKILGCHRHY